MVYSLTTLDSQGPINQSLILYYQPTLFSISKLLVFKKTNPQLLHNKLQLYQILH